MILIKNKIIRKCWKVNLTAQIVLYQALKIIVLMMDQIKINIHYQECIFKANVKIVRFAFRFLRKYG